MRKSEMRWDELRREETTQRIKSDQCTSLHRWQHCVIRHMWTPEQVYSLHILYHQHTMSISLTPLFSLFSSVPCFFFCSFALHFLPLFSFFSWTWILFFFFHLHLALQLLLLLLLACCDICLNTPSNLRQPHRLYWDRTGQGGTGQDLDEHARSAFCSMHS